MSQSVFTNENGEYRDASLAPGTYEVEYRLPGFQHRARDDGADERGTAALQRLHVLAHALLEVTDINEQQEGTSEEKQLVQRYMRQLNAHEDQLETLRREITALETRNQERAAELAKLIEQLSLDVTIDAAIGTGGTAC
jgi:hypothetical protein